MRAFTLWILLTLVRGYRFFFSPWVGQSCRFTPTCSAYALEALHRHGPAGGAYLATRRVLRCHPACAGGLDPVPDRIFSRSNPFFKRLDS